MISVQTTSQACHTKVSSVSTLAASGAQHLELSPISLQLSPQSLFKLSRMVSKQVALGLVVQS